MHTPRSARERTTRHHRQRWPGRAAALGVAPALALALMIAACGSGDTSSAEADSDPSADTGSPSSIESRPADTGDEGPTSSVETDDTAGTDQGEDPDPDETSDPPTTDEPEPEPESESESEHEDVEPTLAQVGPDDSGEDVAALQERLTELGFDPGPADGDYGKRTIRAMLVFQELNQLPPTARADRRTVLALDSFRYDGLSLAAGDEGDDVEELQRRLAGGPFDPGEPDGVYGSATVAAVWALEKLAGVPVDGDWGPADELAWQRLNDGRIGQPERGHDQRWVEVDLSLQLVKVYDPDSTAPILISHASSGSGIPWENEEHRGSSITPLGDFHINRRISGWRESSLNIGRLYNPLYFNGGIAFHGATSVPLYPASHGCIRLPMHVADYLPAELPNGTPVHVLA